MKKEDLIKNQKSSVIRTENRNQKNMSTVLPKSEDFKNLKTIKGGRQGNRIVEGIGLPRKVVMQIADEVAKRLKRRNGGGVKKIKKQKLEAPIFLDTSAIIDGRIFDLISLGVFVGNLVVLEGVLGEIKNIADSKDDVKKERGRRALKALDQMKKQKNVKLVTFEADDKKKPVDEQIIFMAKKHKGRIVTSDYNLSQKAKISGVQSIDLYEMANILKTQALPGETFWVKIIQKGKGEEQGVGYLPDGTMLVVDRGESLIGKTVKVEVYKVIQTDAGRIFFAKVVE
ncbi:MAG: TRAM domain-containing protein [Armatimonadetes bacterium]|nr:MAG: TRAM domain-containing protein [Armatimonadota bacterium]